MQPPSWDEHAEWWQREFTDGADPEYVEQIIPLALRYLKGAGRIIDIGTGEGQIARAAASELGAEVIGVDLSKVQIEEARRRGGGPEYQVARADALPVAGSSMDAAVACLVLEHLDDLPSALSEAARVLRPGGRLLLLLNHPLLQTPGSALIVDHMVEPPETYWRLGPYLPGTVSVDEVQKDVFVRFVHRPLSTYVNGLVEAGLDLVRMEEPPPPAGFLAASGDLERDLAAATPRLLLLVAEKRGTEPDTAAGIPSPVVGGGRR